MEIKAMKILVVIPAYNCKDTIVNTIHSVLNQSVNHEIDVIIVDDASTDITPNILSTFKDKVFIHTNPINLGVSESRNIALKIKDINTFDYIAFCDSDDIWQCDHLQKQIDFLTDNNFDIVCSVPKCIDSKYNEVALFGGINYTEINKANLLQFNRVYISSIVTLPKVINTVGEFDCLLDGVEDWDYWIRSLKAGYRFGMNTDSTIKYLVKDNGMAAISKDKNTLFRRKNPIKLNLGCGTEHLEDYLNCDLYAPGSDLKFDAAKIDLNDNQVDEIRAYHLIEHFDFHKIFAVLKEWHRVLKNGGLLVLETPDFLNSCKRFAEGNEELRQKLYGHFFAWPWLDGQTHKFLFTEDQLKWTLEQCGFTNIIRVQADSIYAKDNNQIADIYLKVVANAVK